jgi:hypothetical protein
MAQLFRESVKPWREYPRLPNAEHVQNISHSAIHILPANAVNRMNAP